jgi:hypothetical protein
MGKTKDAKNDAQRLPGLSLESKVMLRKYRLIVF